MTPLPTADQAKAIAKRLRTALQRTGTDLGHSAALELTAQAFGTADWNTFAATAPAQASDAEQQAVIPILRIFDWDAAQDFYLDYLGFSLEWEHTFEDHMPRYCQVRGPGGAVLHLSEHHGDGTPGTAVLIHVPDIGALYERVSARDYRFARPGLEDATWGDRTMTVNDPFGNRLTFAGRPPAERVSDALAPIDHEIEVPWPSEEAFDRFTGLRWWRDYGREPGGEVILDGDRIFFRNSGGDVEFGRLLSRYRPTRWLCEFTLAQDHDHPTRLDVTFHREPGGTRVRLAHQGWNAANASQRSRFTDWPIILGYFAESP